MPRLERSFSKVQDLVTIWVLAGVALILLTARIVIRITLYGRLKLDDSLVIFAMICVLVSDILNSVMLDSTYTLQSIQDHKIPRPPNYEAIATSLARYEWAIAYLFCSAIWAIKCSFLAYYDTLTQRLKYYRYAWWFMIVVTIVTYIGSLFAYAFLNGLHKDLDLRNRAILYQFSADLTTDILITGLPLSLALRSRVHIRQKLGLAGIFSLTLVITIFSIVRFVLNDPSRVATSPTWIGPWSTIEQSAAMIIACLPTFRMLAVNHSRPAQERIFDVGDPRGSNYTTATNKEVHAQEKKFWASHVVAQTSRSTEQTWSADQVDIELLSPAQLKDSTTIALDSPIPRHSSSNEATDQPISRHPEAKST